MSVEKANQKLLRQSVFNRRISAEALGVLYFMYSLDFDYSTEDLVDLTLRRFKIDFPKLLKIVTEISPNTEEIEETEDIPF